MKGHCLVTGKPLSHSASFSVSLVSCDEAVALRFCFRSVARSRGVRSSSSAWHRGCSGSSSIVCGRPRACICVCACAYAISTQLLKRDGRIYIYNYTLGPNIHICVHTSASQVPVMINWPALRRSAVSTLYYNQLVFNFRCWDSN